MSDNPVTSGGMKALEKKINEFKALSSIARSNNASRFGEQFNGDRKLMDTLGWEEIPTWDTYNGQYKRGNIAKTIVNIRPEDTWRGDITVTVPADKDGSKSANAELFEKQFTNLWESLGMKEFFLRADKLAGIGQYSVMRLGYKESGVDFGNKLEGQITELLYVSVYSQPNSSVNSIVEEPSDTSPINLGVHSIMDYIESSGGKGIEYGSNESATV